MIYTDYYFEELKESYLSIKNTDKLKKTRILVTGCNGLICSAVVDLLIYGNERESLGVDIILAGRNQERIKERFDKFFHKDYLKFIHYDAMMDFNYGESVDYVIHGATGAHPALYASQPVETLYTIVNGTYNILKYASSNSCKRVVFISSSEVYGNKNDNFPYKEEDIHDVNFNLSRSCYPSGKRAAENLCSAFEDEYNLDYVIVRPGHIYGPWSNAGDSKATVQFAAKALNKEDIVMKSAGTQLRSYCYATDCASAIMMTLLHGEKGHAYNVAYKESNVTIRTVAETFAEYSGVNVVFENPSDREKAGYNLMDNSSLDSEHLEKLGWTGTYDIRKGVEHVIENLRRTQN